MAPPYRQLKPELQVLVGALPALAVGALALAAWRNPPGRLSWASAGLAVLVAAAVIAADLNPVRTAPKRKSSLATVPGLVAALLLPAALAGAEVGGAALVANLWLRRSWYSSLYNASGVCLAIVCAAWIGALSGPPDAIHVLRAALAALTFSGLNLVLAALPAALERKESALRRVGSNLRDSWAQILALAAISITVASLLVVAPVAAVLPLAFLPLVQRLNRVIGGLTDANEKLNAVLYSQRRFLTDVSHQVANPLATIQTNLSLLRGARLPRAQEGAVRDAAAEAGRLRQMFARLLLLAETDEELPLHKQRLDLSSLARDVVRAYASDAGRRGVLLQSEVVAPAPVEADENLLRQAAANLVDNAVKHSQRGRQVVIRVGSSDRMASLQVIDEGSGIEPDRLPHIFERFEHGPEGGTGLGLAIARQVVERHGGRIQVESVVGSGSRFEILLPRA